MFDVTALGEILIDFTPAGLSNQGNICFERNPGGAPANVLASISKLGGTTAFIGKVGNDMFGHYLCDVLKSHNIDASGVKFSERVRTTLAFVQLADNGDRSFSFYRNPGADTMLEPSEVDYEIIKNSKVFHFGSLSLTEEPSKTATLEALKFAKANGCTISYDPNLRPRLWESLEHARREIISVLEFADILKVSEEELEFITGEKDLEKGTKVFSEKYGIGLILVTLGPEGCFYRLGEATGAKPTFSEIKPVDTTGAGDSFLGGLLFSMLSRGILKPAQLEVPVLDEMLTFSNAVASLCTAKKGAIPAMPDLEQVKALINSRS